MLIVKRSLNFSPRTSLNLNFLLDLVFLLSTKSNVSLSLTILIRVWSNYRSLRHQSLLASEIDLISETAFSSKLFYQHERF